MAYYDSFTKKPRSKRDDWRDDELTRRPERDQGRSVPTERRAKGNREDERYDRPRPERKPYEREERFGGPRPERKPYEREERFGGPRPERKPYEREERFGGPRPERKPYEREERFGGPRPERKPYEREERFGGPRPERKPYEREERFGGPRPDRRDMRPEPPRPPMPEEENNLLVGRNPIREALKAGRDIEKLLVARGELIGSAREIVAMAREAKIVVQEVDRARLDAMAPNHQGLIAVASAYAYQSVDAMLELAKSRGEAPFLVILDGVTDPHNLGAIIRSAECVGAHGVIVPERRAVGLTPAAVKASAGAVEHIPVARETNLTRTIERLKKEGVWIYGAAMEGEDFRKVDFSGPAALVIGSEGEGLSRLVTENCDKLVSLPMKGKIGSLNASVAAGVLLYAMMGARA